MSDKAVAFFTESDSDRVIQINNVGYNSIPVSQMHQNYPANFWIQGDQDGVDDLCTIIPDTVTSVGGTFQRADSTQYSIQSQDFIGARPPRRPH